MRQSNLVWAVTGCLLFLCVKPSLQVTVDGGFGPWAAWDDPQCPVSCGGGNRTFTRTRACNNPPPDAQGANCTGDFGQLDIRACNSYSCPIDGGFGQWGAWDNPPCPVTCGGANRTFTRTRACDNPTPDAGGANCTGDFEEYDVRECDNNPCPIHGQFGEWGPWNNLSCSVTCGGGTRRSVRMRACDSPAPKFGGDPCEGNTSSDQIAPCGNNSCPIDGQFGQWSQWTMTSCPATCTAGSSLNGTYTRQRACDNPAPQFGAPNCTGIFVQTDTRECNNISCPIDGGFGQWSEWDNQICPVSCGGANITLTRTRACDDPPPEAGGLNCTGDFEEFNMRECNNMTCPIDGGFGPWSEWDNQTCPVTCGGGNMTLTRTRACDSPAPVGGGLNCTGDYEEFDTKECNSTSCPIDGGFGPWSEWDNQTCPVSCGGSNITSTRTRTCDNPPPDAGGLNCTGDFEEFDTRECNNISCPVDGGFGPWSSWASDTCPGSCSGDNTTFTRTRTCDQPSPEFGGLNCSGDYEEFHTRECINNSCPIDGGIGLWSPWACDRPQPKGPCGAYIPSTKTREKRSDSTSTQTKRPPKDSSGSTSTQTRKRSCNNPAPQYGGRDCTETRSQVRTVARLHCINTVVTNSIKDYGYDAWVTRSESPCPVTCGCGIQTVFMNRTCSQDFCIGPSNQTLIRACNKNLCPICQPFTHYHNKTDRTFLINQTAAGDIFYTHDLCEVDKRALGKIPCLLATGLTGQWGDFDFNDACDFSDLPESPISAVLKNLSQRAVTDGNVGEVLKAAVNVTEDTDLTKTDLMHVATILEECTTVSNISTDTLKDVVAMISEVTNTNDDTLHEAQERGKVANRILEAVDNMTDNIELNSQGYIKITSEQYSTEVWNLTHANPKRFPTGLQLQSDGNNQTSISKDPVSLFGKVEPDYTGSETAILLPYEYLQRLIQGSNSTNIRLAMNLYKNPKLFTASQTSSHVTARYSLNSMVISAKILVDGQPVTDLDDMNVTMIFTPDKRVAEDVRNQLTVCGYWNFTENDNNGDWSTDGCTYTKTESGRDVCVCQHLTNFAVLFDFYGQNKLDPAHALSMTIITITGLSLSIFGLSITVFSFVTFRRLRQTRSQRTLFNLALAELCSWIIFLAGINQTQSHVGCIVVAALLHYFILASFMWMLAEAVLHYLLFVKVLGTYTSKYMLKIGIPAWSIPIIPVIIVMAVDPNMYRGGDKYCWMSLTAFYYAFALPVGLVIVCNTILYIIIVFNICRRTEMIGQSTQSDSSRTVLNVRVSLLCFLLLGISWIFGFLTISDARVAFQYIFCITNSIQGFLIFILFMARNKQVRDSWLELCCRKKKKEDGTSKFLLSRSSSSNLRNSRKSSDVNGVSNPTTDNSVSWYDRPFNKASAIVISRR